MKRMLLALAAGAIATPAEALSIVSLHGGITAPMTLTAIDTAVVIVSVLALSGVVAFRLVNR
jgi:hypothetical protein